MPSITRTTPAWLPLIAVALLATSCSDPSSAAPRDDASTAKINTSPDQHRVAVSKDARAASLLPARIRDKGTITIADSAGASGTPPLAFTADDNKTPIGVEVDIAHLLAAKLGVRLDLRTTSWENLFLGADSGAYDVVVSNVTVTEERKEKYDFATYRKDDLAFEATQGGSWKVKSGKDIQGKTIAVSSGTNQEKILLDWNKANIAAGLKPAKIVYYQSASDYYLALSSGRIDAYLGPNPTAAYHVATGGKTEIIGRFSGGGATVQGLIAALSKKNSGLAQPLAAALNSAIADGSYAKVLSRWDLSNEAVPTSQINPPGLPKEAS
ncbi:ABC transporter substrate-binding protein [Luteipulveratus halotolerans]|uniref:ABC transporter substrate-binding protein n=1 Tax=Luteipulveratus halotolerans TaxID=1631356 RepID=A0A0L6CJ16_9MICO|nr:ABC transporter substrate-binding protein [Luteipulveratus halotolerans]KNX37483.1 ABC transporter substrate-binding protein [Luteipulveratus halotolerans]